MTDIRNIVQLCYCNGRLASELMRLIAVLVGVTLACCEAHTADEA